MSSLARITASIICDLLRAGRTVPPWHCRNCRQADLKLYHLNDAGFLARLAERGRGVQSASGDPFRPPRLGILGRGKERTNSGTASLSVAQSARLSLSR